MGLQPRMEEPAKTDHGSEREGGRREEERRPRAAVPVRCHCHRPVPVLVIDGGAGRARGGQASGVGRWGRVGRWQHSCRSGAGVEERGGWGALGGARADLALGRRREEVGTQFFLLCLGARWRRERHVVGLFCAFVLPSAVRRHKIPISFIGPYPGLRKLL
jgi:hypothetical protein